MKMTFEDWMENGGACKIIKHGYPPECWDRDADFVARIEYRRIGEKVSSELFVVVFPDGSFRVYKQVAPEEL